VWASFWLTGKKENGALIYRIFESSPYLRALDQSLKSKGEEQLCDMEHTKYFRPLLGPKIYVFVTSFEINHFSILSCKSLDFWAYLAYDYIIKFAIFSHCSGMKYSIRLPMSCQTNDLIWNWKVLRRPKNEVS
jgi:hypothetical protein